MKLRYAALLLVALVPALLVGCSSDATTGPIIDTTPPLAPIMSGAGGDAQAIGLWWEANTEADLAGYNVFAVEGGVVRKVNKLPVTTNYYTFAPKDPSQVQVYVTAIDYSGNESGASQSKSILATPGGNQREIPGGKALGE